MAKRRRKYIKVRVEEESSLSHEELTAKLGGIMDMQYRRNLKKLKGSPVFLWSNPSEDEYCLKYYHSYGEDMCDTMMTLDIEKGLERCSIHGFIHKPKSIWAVFWGVIASVFIDFLIISYCVLFAESFDLTNALMISAGVCLVRVYICSNLLCVDRQRIKALRTELMNVIKNEQEAKKYSEEYDSIYESADYDDDDGGDDEVTEDSDDERDQRI